MIFILLHFVEIAMYFLYSRILETGMVAGISQQRQYYYVMMLRGLVLCMMTCLFLFSGCGTPSADHPLTTSTDTDIISQGTSSVNPSTPIAPIKVINAQTNLST